MDGFKVVCNKCGAEAKILSNEGWKCLDVEDGKIKFIHDMDATLESVSCECGNTIE